MKVTTLVLAQSAVAHDDGTFSILGGGIDHLTHPGFPAIVTQLSLACKLQFEQSEIGMEQSVEIRAANPKGDLFLPLFGLVVVPKAAAAQDGIASFINFAYNMRDTVYSEPGRYRFSIWSRSRELGAVELALVRSTEQSPAPDNTLAGALGAGFKAFMSGDRAEASRIFGRLVERFPDSPDAHNNLGFTLLAEQHVREARESFIAALDKRPQYRELVEANLAVCNFLLGDQIEAADRFEALMPQPLRSPGSVLFALSRGTYQLMQLISPTDYLALMALNASRSALMGGERSRAAKLAQFAQAGRVSMQGESATMFTRLLDELLTDIES